MSTKSAEKGLTELRDGLGPDAYWKAATWKRLVAIGAGPGANILLAIVLFAVLFMTGSGKATRDHRRGGAGLAGRGGRATSRETGIVAINGRDA